MKIKLSELIQSPDMLNDETIVRSWAARNGIEIDEDIESIRQNNAVMNKG